LAPSIQQLLRQAGRVRTKLASVAVVVAAVAVELLESQVRVAVVAAYPEVVPVAVVVAAVAVAVWPPLAALRVEEVPKPNAIVCSFH
jgi:hypothetical protein